MRVRIVLAVIVVLAIAAGAAAQTTTATISGRVLDAQGGALPGATVTAKSPNLQGSRETVTSANGDYILTGLPSGPYTITVLAGRIPDPDAQRHAGADSSPAARGVRSGPRR